LNEIEGDETLSPNKKEMLTTLIKGSLELTFDMVKNPRERISVKIQKIVPEAILPSYAHDSDAGADIYSLEEVTLKPHTTALIRTGIKVAIPGGYEIQIRPRSGLSLKTPLRVANAPGTIDSAYRGEVCVIMENTGNISQTIKAGDKIAQMVIAPVPMIVWEETDTLDDTDRGDGGFGSTDKS
jgi:dUTP pyrophosphatase